MQVSVEYLLTSSFPVGQEEVYTLTTNATLSGGSRNVHSHCEDVTG